MIDLEDVHMIHLTDDLQSVVTEIEESLLEQIRMLKEFGLGNTKYYKSLLEFSVKKHINNKDK